MDFRPDAIRQNECSSTATREGHRKPTGPFTVFMSSYNQGAIFPEAIEAIDAQCVAPEELLIIDDASTDDNVERIRKCLADRTNCRLHVKPVNRGVMDSIGMAYAQMRTPYAYVLAPDDPILPGLFDGELELMERHPGTGLCFADYLRIYPDGSTEEVRHYLGDSPGHLTPTEFVDRISRQMRFSIPTNTCLYDVAEARRAWAQLDTPALKWHADWMQAFVVAFRKGVAFIPHPLQKIRMTPRSYSQKSRHDTRQMESILRAMMEAILGEALADVREAFFASSIMARYGLPIVRLARAESRYRHLLTPEFVRKAIFSERLNRRRRRHMSEFARIAEVRA